MGYSFCEGSHQSFYEVFQYSLCLEPEPLQPYRVELEGFHFFLFIMV